MGWTRDRRVGAVLMCVGGLAIAVAAIAVLSIDGGDTPSATDTLGHTSTGPETSLPATTASTATTPTTSTTPTTPTTPTTIEQAPTIVVDTTAPTTTVPAETVEQFIDRVLVRGLRSGEIDELVERLHPQVLAVYGEATCRAYLPTVIDPAFAVTIDAIGDPAPWNWETDGTVVPLDAAIPVDVTVTAKGHSMTQQLHLIEIDGKMRWFTDCGDPIDGATP